MWVSALKVHYKFISTVFFFFFATNYEQTLKSKLVIRHLIRVRVYPLFSPSSSMTHFLFLEGFEVCIKPAEKDQKSSSCISIKRCSWSADARTETIKWVLISCGLQDVWRKNLLVTVHKAWEIKNWPYLVFTLLIHFLGLMWTIHIRRWMIVNE